jgi:hypothetical protein
MVLRVIRALQASQDVGQLVLCGPPPSVLDHCPELRAKIDGGEILWLEAQNTPSASAAQALARIAPGAQVLLTTADHALLSPAMVGYFCGQARTIRADVVAALAPYAVVNRAYPETRRTVLRLRDGGLCGCNLYAFLTPRGRAATGFWQGVEANRKRPVRLARLLGWMTVARYVTGRLTLAEGLARMSRWLGVEARAVLMPFPEAAIDVDTVDDWLLARRIVEDRPPSGAPPEPGSRPESS